MHRFNTNIMNTSSFCSYELVDFSWILLYGFDIDKTSSMVLDESTIGEKTHTADSEPEDTIQYDADGIPINDGKEATAARRIIIRDFYHHWNEDHPEKRVHNSILNDDILIRGISIVEAKEHAAKRYRSTLAVLHLEEVLANARPVARVPVKAENSNQSSFDYMLLMTCELDNIGTIKLTVGVREKKTQAERIQYGISALDPEQAIVSPTAQKVRPAKKRRKRKAHR